MGNAHLVELLEKARRSRTPVTQQAVAGIVDEDAGADPEVDGAAGGGRGDGGGGDGDSAVARDPKKYCWNCKTCDHHASVKLRVCSGCNRVIIYMDRMFADDMRWPSPHPCTLACSLKSCTSD